VFPRWLPDHEIGLIEADTRDGAGRSAADILACRRLGEGAKATTIQWDGTPQGRSGAFYRTHIGRTKDGCYVGEDIRFLIVDEEPA
jgi:hypothetical protein